MSEPKNMQSEPRKAHMSNFRWFRPVVVGSCSPCGAAGACAKGVSLPLVPRAFVRLVDRLERPGIYGEHGYQAAHSGHGEVEYQAVAPYQ